MTTEELEDLELRKLTLKRWMKRNRLTMADLGELLSLSERRVSQMLDGETAPPEHVMTLIAYDVPADLLPRPERLKPGPKPRGECVAGAA